MTSQKKKRVLTGSRATGMPHLGNYFGAYKPAIDLQDRYELFLFLADFHALNEHYSPEENRRNSLILVAAFLACGLDPVKSLLYAQSAVPEVNELAWILSCQVPYGVMARAHSFKDAQAKGIEVNMGVFNYPILMAADILLFDANLVPVGQDQKQHLEMTRDMAQRFNHHFGQALVIPDPMISETVAIVPGTDGEKMSKSKNNTVALFASDKDWKKQVMNIVTDAKGLADSKNPDTCNVFKLFTLVANEGEVRAMREKYVAGGYGYGHAKMDLLEKMKVVFGPMRDNFDSWMQRPGDLRDILHEGSKKARSLATEKLNMVQEKLGLIGRPF
ncbi:MAG: tryptophan--tRNA ligase [Pseudomonadota bacterium]